MNETVFNKEFFQKLELLSLNITPTLTTGSSGSRKSKAKGMSVEFSDYKDYVAGDDFRRIDWNAYGRFRKLYIKLFVEEKQAIFRIFIDCSQSMSYGEHKKSTSALQVAAALSYISTKSLDKTFIHPINTLESVPPISISSKNNFINCIDYLSSLDFNGKSSLYDEIRNFRFNGPGVSVIISDLFIQDDLDKILKYLRYNKQKVILIHTLCQEEMHPKIDGRLKLIDSETGLEKNIYITPTLLKQYKNSLDKYMKVIHNYCTKYESQYILFPSDSPIEKIFYDLGKFK